MTEQYNSEYRSYSHAVTAAKNGEQDAFRFLYESTYRDKYYIAQKYMRNEADAQDVLQDAYMKAWTSLSQLQEPDRFPGWLSMIVASTALNALKKKKDLPFSELEKASEDGDLFEFEEEDWRKEYQPEHAYTDKETSELLRGLLDALSDEQRFCMLMYYVEEHSVKEIAQLIGCSENTVKSRLNYGRKNLKTKAEDMEKKGYTLYSLAPVSLLLWLLRKEAKAAEITFSALDTATAAAAAKSGTGGSIGTSVGGATTAKVTSVSLGVKIAVAALTVSVLGGAGMAATRLFSPSSAERAVNEDTSDTEEEDDDVAADTDTDMEEETSDFASQEVSAEATAEVSDEGVRTSLPWEDWGGLYSCSKNGHYYYVWLEKGDGSSDGELLGTIRLLWEGSRPYAEGDALLPDEPRGIYIDSSIYGYWIRPAWNGEETSWIVPDHGDMPDKIHCFDTIMKRETSLIYDGNNLWEK